MSPAPATHRTVKFLDMTWNRSDLVALHTGAVQLARQARRIHNLDLAAKSLRTAAQIRGALA